MTQHNPKSSRRSFLKTSAAASVAAASSLSALHAAGPVHGGVKEEIKVGLVGCGGRGTGAAAQALGANKQNVLWSTGDAFGDRMQSSLQGLEEAGFGDRAKVPQDRQFTGLDAIDKVLDSGVDAVILATPPGFRPMQIEKAVAKGVHVFAEKPIASDADGVRRVMAACEEARKKGLSIVSGLCYRYEDGRRELMSRLHDGDIGQILAIQGDYITGELWSFDRKAEMTDMEWQLRNWLYYTWLSGDMIAEQHIHTLDVMAWIKKDEYPVKAVSLGGRQVRTAPKFGNVYDHFSTIYEWADGTRGYSHCRQQNNCYRNVNELVMGTEGTCRVFQKEIAGKKGWKYEGKARDMYQAEHDEMFAAIRAGQRIDNGDYMCKSTLMAIMGRMAAYTGKQVTWEEALNSKEILVPKDVRLDAVPPEVVVAVPGITKFV